MPLRKEENKDIYGTEYKIKQLPATQGNRLMIRLTKLITSGAGALKDLLENPLVKKIIEEYFTESLIINEMVLSALPEDMSLKIKSLSGQTFKDVVELKKALDKHLSPDEVQKHHLRICQLSAQTGTPEFKDLISISGYFLALFQGIIDKVDPEEYDAIVADMINLSVQRYKPEGQEKAIQWYNSAGQFYEFDDHFAGNYHEMMELFVYLVLFNYAESLKLVKKNRIPDYLRTYLSDPKKQPEKT